MLPDKIIIIIIVMIITVMTRLTQDVTLRKFHIFCFLVEYRISSSKLRDVTHFYEKAQNSKQRQHISLFFSGGKNVIFHCFSTFLV